MKLKIFAAFMAACVMMAGIASAQATVVGRDMFLSYTNNSTIVDMDAYIGEHNGTLEMERSLAMGRWSSGEADMSKIVEDTNLKRLVLDTAGDIVTNSLTGAETLSNAISSGGETYIQSRMLFVPSDEIEPSFLDYSGAIGSVTLDNGDLKFGLYAYEYDVTKIVTEGDTTKEVIDVVTNLVIYHSYYATPTTIGGDIVYPVVYTNYVVATPSFDFSQPHTVLVTLKKAKNRDIYFKVRIDSTDISTPLGCKLDTIDQAVLPVADEGPWFRAVCNAAAMSNGGISAINFSGTGEIHNLQSSYISSSTEPAEPTVISVVKLSSTSSKVGSDPTFTAIVTDSEGKPVDAANYTIDTSAINTNKAGLYPVVITATGDDFQGVITNYYAVMNLTWFNGVPTQKALINPQNARLWGVHYMHTSQDRAYLAVNGVNGDGNGEGHLLLYSVDTLKSLYGTCQGVWEVAHNTAGGGKGIAANTASGIMLAGWGKKGYTDIVGTTTTFKGYDISDLDNIGNTTNLVADIYTAEWEGSGYESGQIMDGLDFNHAGTKVFGNDADADGPWVYQFAIDKNAKTMTWEATYTTGFGRVRSVSSYYIDDKDYIFAGEGGSSGRGEIAVIDPSNGSVKTICVAADDFTTDEFPAGRYFTNVKISGIASGEMYLYGSTDKGEVLVWALGHDAVTGEWMTAPVANITSAQAAALASVGSIGNSRAFEVSDDNTAAFLYAQAQPGQFAVVTDESLARRKALTSATLSPTGSNKDVALGEITAAVIDENGATVAASEYTITTNLIDITTVGKYTVTITPVEGSVYSNAVTAVYTISEAPAAGFNYPEGGAIDDAAVVAWLTGKGATQAQINALGSVAALNEKYLLNLDLEGSSYTLKIKSLTVGDNVKVEVELVRANGEVAVTAPINGKLQLWGTADLGSDFADCGLSEISNADFSDGTTAVKSFTPATGVKFFKAVIVNPTAAE